VACAERKGVRLFDTLIRPRDGREPVAYIALYGRIAPELMAQGGIGTLGVTAVNAPSFELS